MKRIIIILLFISIFSMPKQSFALSCVEPPPPDIAYNKYAAVISGTVQNMKETNDKRILTIEVNKSFKGVDKKSITVEEDLDWGRSELNVTYIYFLNKESGNWVHPLCSPTTTDISIANKFFADKKEIPLQNAVESENTPLPKHTLQPFIIILVAIIILGLAVSLVRKRKNNNK